MKKSKNGFTLIELLMTIIIISVVAFIAMSMIDFSIKGSRKKSKENEDEILKDAVEVHVSLNQMDNSGYTKLDELCMEDSLTYNSKCSEVVWCKILIADLVDSGAIQSFPSNVLNEDGSKAYNKDTSFAYVQFINGNLVPSSISIDPDLLDNTCPNDLSTKPETPDVPEEPSDEDNDTSISEFVENYDFDDSLIVFYDGEYNQRTTTVHSSNTSIWYDLVGDGDSDLSLPVDSDSKPVPVWEKQCLNFKANSTDYINAIIDLYSEEYGEEIAKNGFTIYSVFSNSDYDNSITNYAFGLTDSDNKLILTNGMADAESSLKYAYEVPGAFKGATGSQNTTSFDKKIVSAIVLSPSSSDYADWSGYPTAKITFYVDGSATTETFTSVGSLKSMITQVVLQTGYEAGKPISKLHIGGISGLDAKPYDTCIYNFLIYKKALTSEQIKSLYDNVDSKRFSS